MMSAIRGATTVEHDDKALVDRAVGELLDRIYSENGISDGDVEFALFSQTGDIKSSNAASSARRAGFLRKNAIFCTQEAEVDGMLPFAIRVLVYTSRKEEPVMVYLNGASSLRPDFKKP